MWSHPYVPDTICELLEPENQEMEIVMMRQAVFPIYHQSVMLGGLPFHCALVEHDGVGVLLAGNSGAGKSTCCRRLPSSWNVLCDDEALILGHSSEFYTAHPFPTWNDVFMRPESTWNVQQGVSLSAVFFLEHGQTDEVVPMGRAEAAIRGNHLAGHIFFRDWESPDSQSRRAATTKLFDNVLDLIRAVPAFILRVSANGQFWSEMERVL